MDALGREKSQIGRASCRERGDRVICLSSDEGNLTRCRWCTRVYGHQTSALRVFVWRSDAVWMHWAAKSPPSPDSDAPILGLCVSGDHPCALPCRGADGARTCTGIKLVPCACLFGVPTLYGCTGPRKV